MPRSTSSGSAVLLAVPNLPETMVKVRGRAGSRPWPRSRRLCAAADVLGCDEGAGACVRADLDGRGRGVAGVDDAAGEVEQDVAHLREALGAGVVGVAHVARGEVAGEPALIELERCAGGGQLGHERAGGVLAGGVAGVAERGDDDPEDDRQDQQDDHHLDERKASGTGLHAVVHWRTPVCRTHDRAAPILAFTPGVLKPGRGVTAAPPTHTKTRGPADKPVRRKPRVDPRVPAMMTGLVRCSGQRRG